MKRLLLISAIIAVLSSAYCQSTMLWSSDFTTEQINYFSAPPLIQTIADTIKVIGRQNTVEGQKLLIVNYDLFGDTISTKTYGSDSVLNNSIIDYKFDATNNVYILHKEQLGFYKSKIVLQKYSFDGALIWVKQIQNSADTSYTPRSLGIANDTCIFLTAHKEYDYPGPDDDVIQTTMLAYLYAYNSDGNLLWQREFNPETELEWFSNDIFVHDNTAYLFTSVTYYIKRLIKVDIYNNLTVNTNTGPLNGINNIQLSSDGNLIITAWTRYRISKTDLNGSLIWTHEYGTNLPSNVSADEMRATIQDEVGNIYITGRHGGFNYGTPNYTNADILTLKYDSNGNLIWHNRYQYGVNNADIANTILLKDGQIYVGGNSQRLGQGSDYDYVVLKIDSATGETSGVYRYDGLDSGNDAVTSLSVFDNGNVALTGISFVNSQYNWTTQLLSGVILSLQKSSYEEDFLIYPNPASGGEILTLVGKDVLSYSIISSIGQVVQEGIFERNNLNQIQLMNISNGFYLLYLQTDKEMITKKIIVR
jgi:hypothetical protein